VTPLSFQVVYILSHYTSSFLMILFMTAVSSINIFITSNQNSLKLYNKWNLLFFSFVCECVWWGPHISQHSPPFPTRNCYFFNPRRGSGNRCPPPGPVCELYPGSSSLKLMQALVMVAADIWPHQKCFAGTFLLLLPTVQYCITFGGLLPFGQCFSLNCSL